MTNAKSLKRSQRASFQFLIAVAFQTLLASGCGDSQSPTSPPSGQATVAQVDAPAAPVVASDNSLTVEEYILLEVPAPDRDWSGEDMVKAAKVFSSLAQDEPQKLPRHESERSGKVFARLTSPQNLDQFKNHTLPLKARMALGLTYFEAYNQVFKVYLAAFLNKNVRDSEAIEVTGALLRLTVVLLELIEEWRPTITMDDPNYQVRMQGLDQMKRGLASIISGGLQMLSERQTYRERELVRLVAFMNETFPQMVRHLPDGTRTETLLRLAKMNEDPAFKCLQPGLGELHSKVKASIEKEAAAP